MAEERFVPRSQPIGDLLYNLNSYVVPAYQRDYSWKKAIHIENFWNDIQEIEKEGVYFLGSVLFQISKESKNYVTIIDGQQRLTTITLLLAVIRDRLMKEDLEDTHNASLINTYIIRERKKDHKIRKLILNRRNKDFFYHCIQCHPAFEEEHKTFTEFEKEFGRLQDTNKLLRDAYLYLEEKVEEEISKRKDNKSKVDYLIELSEKLRENLSIITISVDNSEDAYMIFETINERGLELSVSDLFKNYLISKSKNKEEMVEIWDGIFNILDNNIKPFLKHYWHTKQGVTQERKLFRALKGYVEEEGPENIEALTRELRKEAVIYSALKDPDSEYWEREEIRELLRDYKVLGIKQALPILLVANIKFSEEGFLRFLDLIVNFTFRYFIICNFSPALIERRFSEISIKIREGEIKNEKEALEEMEKRIEKYPSDEFFQEPFVTKTYFKENKIAKYILKKIEQNMFEKSKKEPDKNTEPIDYEKLTLEHILPQSMDSEWKDYFKKEGIPLKDATRNIYRIGNLTLLDEIKNGFAKNSIFLKKRKKAYEFSKLRINEPLKKMEEWGVAEIESRTIELTKEALEVWKLDLTKKFK